MLCFIVAAEGHVGKVVTLTTLAKAVGCTTAMTPSLEALRTLKAFSEAVRPVVLLPDFSATGELAEAAIQFAAATAGHAYLVYVADTVAPETYKRLLRTHAGDWSRWDALPNELSDAVKRLAGGASPGATAKIISFLPSKGGVGTTTLAAEIAVYLASMRKRSTTRIALLDLNLAGGTLADALDIEPRFDLHEIADRPERLDDQLVDVFTSRHSNQLDIFAAPRRRKATGEIDPKIIFAALDLMASRYDVILLDIPNQRLPWIDNLLHGSDLVLLLGTGTVPALKQLGAKLSEVDDLAIDPAKMAVIVNQSETNVLNRVVRRQEIERALPARHLFFVRQDVAAVSAANNAGRPLMELSPGSAVCKDIRRVADWIELTTGGGKRS